MGLLKRFLAGKPTSPPASPQPFTINYPGGTRPLALRVDRTAPADTVIAALNLPSPRPTLFLTGGAALMTTGSLRDTRSNMEDGLARFAQERNMTVIDGGTTSGIMGMIGIARARRSYTFPLIGVAPERCVEYPGYENPNKQAELDAFHSHHVLTSGDKFGDESDLLLRLVTALSGDQKRLAILINGGQVARDEIHRAATGETPLPILILEGSGRLADELSAARRGLLEPDETMRAILEQGQLYTMPITAGAERFRDWLENFFS
jgi:hypothetical protein